MTLNEGATATQDEKSWMSPQGNAKEALVRGRLSPVNNDVDIPLFQSLKALVLQRKRLLYGSRARFPQPSKIRSDA